MITRDKQIEFIDKLIEMTQHQQIVWNVASPDRELNSTTEHVNSVYEAYLHNMCVRVYEKKYKYYYDESDFSWNEEVIIEIIDPNNGTVMQKLTANNAIELLKAINYKTLYKFYSDVLG